MVVRQSWSVCDARASDKRACVWLSLLIFLLLLPFFFFVKLFRVWFWDNSQYRNTLHIPSTIVVQNCIFSPSRRRLCFLSHRFHSRTHAYNFTRHMSFAHCLFLFFPHSHIVDAFTLMIFQSLVDTRSVHCTSQPYSRSPFACTQRLFPLSCNMCFGTFIPASSSLQSI
jgi:hypothetical protein